VAVEGNAVPHSTAGPADRDHETNRLAHVPAHLHTLLHANGEDVKVVQELLRHGSARITMDVYAQAMTPAKREAQGKVVAMLRERDKNAG
jgi:integrase